MYVPCVADQSQPREIVRLGFDWGAGITATVRAVRSKPGSTPGAANREFVTEATMIATREPGGSHLVEMREHRFPESDAARDGERARMEAMMSGAIEPPVRLSESGEFVGLADYDKARAAMIELINATTLAGQAPSARKRIEAAMGPLLTREYLEASVRRPWDAFIGQWTGAVLEMGRSYELEQQSKVPLLGGRKIRQFSTLSFTGRTACASPRRELVAPVDSSGPDDTLPCVRLRMTTEFDPEAVQRAVRELAGLLGARAGPLPEGAIRDLQVYTETDVVVEPRTMRPHYGLQRSTSTVTFEAGGAGKPVEEVESMELTWLYKSE